MDFYREGVCVVCFLTGCVRFLSIYECAKIGCFWWMLLFPSRVFPRLVSSYKSYCDIYEGY